MKTVCSNAVSCLSQASRDAKVPRWVAFQQEAACETEESLAGNEDRGGVLGPGCLSPGHRFQLEEESLPGFCTTASPLATSCHGTKAHRQTQGTKERFNGGRMRTPRGLVVTHHFPDAGCGEASEEVRRGLEEA